MEDQTIRASAEEDHRDVELQKKSDEDTIEKRLSHCSSHDIICGLWKPASNKSEKENRSKSSRKLSGLIILCLIFVCVEVVGGVKANSLAVLTDAAHLLTDVTGFSISLFAVWASGWEATPRHSFGFFRLEVLGALFSVQLIWLITGFLIYKAIHRILEENVVVNGKLMFVTAVLGFFINLTMITWLGHDHSHHGHTTEHDHGHHGHTTEHDHGHHGHTIEHDHCHHDHDHKGHCSHETEHDHNHHDHDHKEHCSSEAEEAERPLVSSTVKEQQSDDQVQNQRTSNWIPLPLRQLKQTHINMNVQSAYLHVLGDLIQSIGVMLGGAIIWAKPNWLVVDLICTLSFSVLVLLTTIGMIRDTLSILMESAPNGIDIVNLETGLRCIRGVQAVHDLHVWAISVGKISLSCQITAEQGANSKEIIRSTRDYCERVHHIQHVTIQIEQE